jgi:hypothetical protein
MSPTNPIVVVYESHYLQGSRIYYDIIPTENEAAGHVCSFPRRQPVTEGTTKCKFTQYSPLRGGWDSVVSTATHYGLEGPGIDSQRGRGLPQPSRMGLGPTQPPTQ